MMRGNIHLEAVIELRSPPSAAEVNARIRSTVAIFLRGAQPPSPVHGDAPGNESHAELRTYT